MAEIEFNKSKFAQLKKAYAIAVKDGKDSFLFEGKELLTSYAKYLIEYLTTLFKPN